MSDSRYFKNPLNRHNIAAVRQIATRVGTITYFDLLTLSADKIWICKIQHGGRPPFSQINIRHICAAVRPIATKFCTMTHTDCVNGIYSLKSNLKNKMAHSLDFEKPLNRHNSATFHQIAMKFGTMTYINPFKPTHG